MTQLVKILLLIPFGFFWIQWFAFAIQPGNVLGFVSKFDTWIRNKFNEDKIAFLLKPLWGCEVCMASVHGGLTFVVFWFVFPDAGLRWIDLPIYLVSLSGFIVAYHEILSAIESHI